jgi:mono/diheme cytochrome c family protein
MSTRASGLIVLCLGVWFILPSATAEAALDAEQQRELREIQRDVGQVATLARRKRVEEAEKLLDECEDRLKKLQEAAELSDDDRAVAGILRQIEQRRKQIDAQKGESGGGQSVSFTKDVAPILASRCVSCHGDNPRGNRPLDTFAGMKRRGASGPLLAVGKPTASLLVRKLVAQGDQRMPRGAPALSREEINTIGQWIAQGAKFDGDSETTKLADLTPSGPDPDVTIAMATGDETVSFTKDIAPFMANLCVGCHSGNNPRGGLSLVNFEGLMRGGDSGRVLLPGNLEGSRLWRLVGGLELPRMPQGQARITRKNYEDLKTWITEGLKYDGDNPRTPLRQLVPSQAEIRAMEFAELSPEEFDKHRLERSHTQWKRSLPGDRASWAESKEVVIYGNVGDARLQEIVDWSEEHVKSLRSLFGVKDDLVWKGRLTVFVFKDRFGYEEFNQTIHNRQVPREATGHSEVTASFEDAFVALEDVGDEASESSPGLRVNLIDHLTGAYLRRTSGDLPEWLLRGTGLALAEAASPANPFIDSLRGSAMEAVKTSAQKPEDVFANGTFSPADIGAVGYTLVDYMLSASRPKFGQFVARLQSGNSLDAALKAVYNADRRALATAYFSQLGKQRRGRR